MCARAFSYATISDINRVCIVRCVSLERVKLDLFWIVGAPLARAAETRIPPGIACSCCFVFDSCRCRYTFNQKYNETSCIAAYRVDIVSR